jgi:hypothetical protein
MRNDTMLSRRRICNSEWDHAEPKTIITCGFTQVKGVVRGGVEPPTFRFSGGFADPRRSIARR